MTLLPAAPAPLLDLPLTRGGTTADLDAGEGRFTLLLFFRGLHCPVCRSQLKDTQRRLGDLREAGISRVLAISTETQERSEQLLTDWKLDTLDVAHGLDPKVGHADWNLFVSAGIKEAEPALFTEPGMFLLDNRDDTVAWQTIASMPWARPDLDAVIKGVQFMIENDYPARGEVAL